MVKHFSCGACVKRILYDFDYLDSAAKTDKSRLFDQMSLYVWTNESAVWERVLLSLCSIQEALISWMLTANRINMLLVAQGVNDTNKEDN